MAFKVGLSFMRTPQDLGLTAGSGITFTARFRAQGPVKPVPPPTPTRAPFPTATAIPPTAAPQPTATPAGGELIAQGRHIYLNVPANVAPQALWCSQCHQIEGVSTGLIGPDLTHIGTAAATRKPNMTAEEYIIESITDPEAFIPTGVERATAGLMTRAIAEGRTKDQVNALVAFLLEQR